MLKPNVSHCVSENEVHYNPKTWADEYLTIESLEDDNTIYLKASNSSVTKTISASTDNGANWTEYTSSTGDSGTTLAMLNKGNRLLVKGKNIKYSTEYSIYNQFKSTGQFEVKGNIMSLISGDSFSNADESTATYTFNQLFYQCTGLTSAENLILPATKLPESCYSYMFSGCTSLTTAPELPATTLAQDCYEHMFAGCTSLTTAPELPATTLASSCYFYMFDGCASLTTAPELPAETISMQCYCGMFQGCTALTAAPELPAAKLKYSSYGEMFNGCTNLNYIKCLATDISASYCTNNWVSGVAANGTFVKASSMTSWKTTGASGIPSGWAVQDT